MKQATSPIDRGISQSSFGHLPNGTEVPLYQLTNANGLRLDITPYGGIIVGLYTPDADGIHDDIVLGFDRLSDYLSSDYQKANPYFGALIGRYGNRIAEGTFTLGSETYELATNDGDNHLHGGEQGFNQRLWSADPFENDTGVGLVLTLTSQDGDQGYPGRVEARVCYTLSDDNALVIDYRATSTAPTPINLTQHSYFNLEGEGSGDILDHRLEIAADHFTPVDESLIPTGEYLEVVGTPFDFRTPTAIGACIDFEDTQLSRGQGYDHNFIINREGKDSRDMVRASRLVAPSSGRVLEVHTSEPGLQVYSGNFLDGSLIGKSGRAYTRRTGLALETQHFPDSPNQVTFPSTILMPDEVYQTRTKYVFSTTMGDLPDDACSPGLQETQ